MILGSRLVQYMFSLIPWRKGNDSDPDGPVTASNVISASLVDRELSNDHELQLVINKREIGIKLSRPVSAPQQTSDVIATLSIVNGSLELSVFADDESDVLPTARIYKFNKG